MVLAKVVGTTTATLKHPSMQGWRLLIVQPLMADSKSPDGEPVLAVDKLGAGSGSYVMITSDGKAVREWLKDERTPVRWGVLGICD